MKKEDELKEEFVDANDLVYLRSRYYDPDLGTFLSLDHSEGSMNDPMSLNGYAYAHGNPINRTDPSGSMPLNITGSNQLASIMNAGLCASMNAALLQGCDIITFLLNGFSCPTPILPPFVTNTPQPTATPTPTETPTPSPTPVGDLRRRAITLAAFSEAGGLTEDDRRVVIFTIFNRENFPNAYAPIEQALGGSQIAGGVLSGFSGDRITQINNAYDWYPNQPQYAGAFQNADASVTTFLANPPVDFTQGAIQFSHAATPDDARDIAAQINHCGQGVIEGIIRNAGIEPIVNGPSMYAGSTNVSAYINMNYTLPGAPNCP